MKKTLFITFIIMLFSLVMRAQDLSPEVQAVYDACLQMQSAIGSGGTAELRDANTMLKACNTSYFNSIRIVDEEMLPAFDGHFIFDYEFVDSLIVNRKVYSFATRYADRCAERGASSEQEKVSMKTCMVGGKSSTKFTFVSRGHKEMAFVTEPGGKITVRIHDKTNDAWYNDTKDVTKGRSSRVLVFDLPADKRCSLEVEVINKSKDDISFVVISNY